MKDIAEAISIVKAEIEAQYKRRKDGKSAVAQNDVEDFIFARVEEMLALEAIRAQCDSVIGQSYIPRRHPLC